MGYISQHKEDIKKETMNLSFWTIFILFVLNMCGIVILIEV